MEQNEVDIYIGNQLRRVRRARRLSQKQLGDLIAVSYQQVQKYERGANRISASTLFLIATALEEDVQLFLPGDAAVSKRDSILDAKVIDALEDLTNLFAKRQQGRSTAFGTRRRC